MSLTDMLCRNAKAGAGIRKLSDGGGLQLWIQTTGSRQWRLAYRFDGKQKALALGPYPRVSLADARQCRDDAKKLLADGIDPAAAKRQAKAALEEGRTPFRTIAEEYVAKLKLEGRAEATIEKTEWLLSFAYPKLGSRSIREIRASDVLDVLRKVEARGRYESARRLRSTVGAIFRYAIATDRADTDPTFVLKGALITPNVRSRAAITDPEAFGALLRAIESYEGQPGTHAALKPMALLFPRPGELRAARWSEFDLDRRVWTIPEGRTKMRRPHRVALSTQAIAALKKLADITEGDLLFPASEHQRGQYRTIPSTRHCAD